MDNVEQYIQDYTRMCSNECHIYVGDGIMKFEYTPWLTPDHARAVAKIAREAVIEKALDWVKSRCTERGFLDFKKYMEESV